jgi:cobyrinic acid a,c-diamide synthase
VYVGGGFPELFARELAANRPMHAALRRAAADGLPIYAECGGLMYLAERLIDFDGVCHEMVGLAPGCSALDRPRLTLGYRVATARRSSFLLRAGEQVRGHEFHWSQLRGEVPAATAAYELHDGAGRLEGYAVSNVVASYLHLHFGSDPRLAQRFVTACAGEAASDSAGPDSRTDKGTATR